MADLRFSIDRCDATLVGGWIDDDGPVAAIDIEIEGRWVCTLAPTVFREDLKEAGVGDGRRAFAFPLLGRLQPGENRITMRVNGNVFHETSLSLPPAVDDPSGHDVSQRRWRGDEPAASLTWGRLMTGDSLWNLYQTKRRFSVNDKILEIGPGYGRLLKTAIEREIPFASYTAVDLSVERVAKLCHEFQFPNVRVFRGDIDTWESDQSYDVVLCSGTFEHLHPDCRNALKNIRRQMAPRGQLFIDFIFAEYATRGFEPDGTYVRIYTRDELSSMFTECGFTVRGIERCRLGEGAAGTVDRSVIVADLS
jgi:hypothetical protein